MPARAPLFAPAIAFAVGVAIQIAAGSAAAWHIWLAATCILFCAWWLLQRKQNPHRERLAALILMLFVGAAGATHCALVTSTQKLTLDDIANLTTLQATHGSATWVGTIVTRPRVVAGKNTALRLQSTSFIVYVDSCTSTAKAAARPVHGLVFARLTERGEAGKSYLSWARGDTVRLSGALSEPRHARNPGELDEVSWLSNQGIAWIFRGEATQCHTVADAPRSWSATAAAWAERARDWTRSRLTLGIESDPATCDMLSGMILGARQLDDPALSQAFRRTGTYHIFAVSGQNVMMVAAVGTFALWLLGINTYRWAVAFVPGVIAYCAMTGFEPSVVRAMVMTCVLLAGSSAGLPVSALNTWSLALLGFLMWDPKSLLDIGFQLSFAVVLTLILLTPTLYNLIPRPDREKYVMEQSQSVWAWLTWLQAGVTLTLASSMAAWIGSFPLSVWHFHQISFIAILANIPVVMLAGAIVTLGTVSVCLSVISSTLAAWLNCLNLLLCKILTGTVYFFAAIPGGSLYVPGLNAPWYPSHPHILLLDSGPGTGGSAIIRYKARTWLINPGRDSAYTSVTSAALRSWGVNSLEVIVSTELTQRQSGAAELLLSTREYSPKLWLVPAGGTRSPFYSRMLKSWTSAGYKVDTTARRWLPGRVKNLPLTDFVEPDETLPSILQSTPRILIASSGYRLELDKNLSVTVLSPDMSAPMAPRAENRSIVLLLQYKAKRIIWAGRIHPDIQSAILTAHPGLTCDILIQAWNPLISELQKEWILALRPRHIVRPTSDGQNLHLLDSTIASMHERERPTLWYQDTTGALAISMDTESIMLHPFITGSGQYPVKPVLPPIYLPDYYRQLEAEDVEQEQDAAKSPTTPETEDSPMDQGDQP